MPSYEAFTLPAELAKDLGVSSESKLTRVDVNINYHGYFWLCRRTFQVMRSKWLTWFPTDDVPLTEADYLIMCAALLYKRIDFVRAETLSEDSGVRVGIGKSIQIPAPIFDRLYIYGAVRVGNDLYLPTRRNIVEWLSDNGLIAVGERLRPSEDVKRAYSEFVSTLEPRMVVSTLMPAKPQGTLSMLFYIDETTEYVRPYCITDQASGADAVMAAIAPDQPISFEKGNKALLLNDVLSFIYTSPYTAIEAPDVALTNFIQRGFRGGGTSA